MRLVGLGLKILMGLIVAVIVGCSAALIYSGLSGGHVKPDPSVAASRVDAKAERFKRLEVEVREQRKKARKVARERQPSKIPAASAGSNGTPGQSATQSAGQASGSFAQLESEISGQIGVAYAPLGSDAIEQLGALQVGHAWSSFKVPIVVTLMLEQHGSLTSSQESLAASAITASDNGAAASLFDDLESASGGRASQAIESVLSQIPGGATQVATAPPPSGAVSSWGQTEWTLTASTSFYGAMACEELGSAGHLLAYMEQVIPEQQWGLGEAPFPSGTSVAFKAGWGPDGSASGPYLVRQAGILRSGSTGAAVTIAAQDESGSFEAGVADLNLVADWVAQHVPLQAGSC